MIIYLQNKLCIKKELRTSLFQIGVTCIKAAVSGLLIYQKKKHFLRYFFARNLRIKMTQIEESEKLVSFMFESVDGVSSEKSAIVI